MISWDQRMPFVCIPCTPRSHPGVDRSCRWVPAEWVKESPVTFLATKKTHGFFVLINYNGWKLVVWGQVVWIQTGPQTTKLIIGWFQAYGTLNKWKSQDASQHGGGPVLKSTNSRNSQLQLGTNPHPGCNRHHQEYEPFFCKGNPNLPTFICDDCILGPGG